MKSKDEMLDDLLAKQEILELLARYCRGCDRCDEDLLASVYHPDAIDDHGFFKGPVKLFAKWATELHRSIVSTSHFISNSIIEINGNTAAGETYCNVWGRSNRDDGKLEDVVWGGRYIDRFEKRDGLWKFSARFLLIDWHTLLDVRNYEPSDFTASFILGSRNGDDLSYKFIDQSWSK